MYWIQGFVWSLVFYGFGGNGVLFERCVIDGLFRENEFCLFWFVGGGCLKRDFNFLCFLLNFEDIWNLVMFDNFIIFE